MKTVILSLLLLNARLDDPPATYEGLTAEQWIAKLAEAQDLTTEHRATSALVRLGAAAVEPLTEYVEHNGPHLACAFTAVCRIGEPASLALDRILEIAKDREYANPDAWNESMSARHSAVWSLRDAGWASDRVVPVLEALLFDLGEDDDTRYSALASLGALGEPAFPAIQRILEETEVSDRLRLQAIRSLQQYGEKAIPLLEPIANQPMDPHRERAIVILGRVLETTGRQGKSDYYRERIFQDITNPQVPWYVVQAKGTYNLQRRDELTEEVKQALAKRFAETRDPELAHRLAIILQYQLFPSLMVRMACPNLGRENPEVNFEDLREVLELGFAATEESSELRRTLGTALAKLHLLRGEWSEMNRALLAIVEEPIDEALRPWLHAPPTKWMDLASSWGECDPIMRSGTCAFELQVEKDGKGLQGVHVLLKKAGGWGGSTAFPTDTIFFGGAALGTVAAIGHSFGYPAENRAETRYAVTDDSGRVRFDSLPEMELELEVLIPTANFPESGWKWELWQDAFDSTITRVVYTAEERIVLNAGKTFVYPKLYVKSHGAFRMETMEAVDPEDYVVSWDELSLGDADSVHQELELALAMPDWHSGEAEDFRAIRRAVVEVEGNEWPLGAQGVGDLRLIPGNFYTLQLMIRDASGAPLARYGRVAIYVPWSHRRSNAPHRGRVHEPDSFRFPPLAGSMWDEGTHRNGDGRVETIRESVTRYVRDCPDDFEHEYAAVVKAWLDWRDGDSVAAREQLAQIAAPLAEGNVVRETALRLIRSIDAGESSNRPLCFGDAFGQAKR